MIRVYVAGTRPENILQNVDVTSIRISDTLSPSGDLCEFTMVLYASGIRKVPQTEEEVIVQRQRSSYGPVMEWETIFGGVIEEVEWERLTTHSFLGHIRCRDYLKRFDRRNIYGVYIQSDPGAMLRAIMDDFLTVAAGNEFSYDSTSIPIGGPVAIYPKSLDLQPPSNIFNEIADITKQNWYIDFDKKVWYVDLYANAQLAPLQAIDFDSDNDVGDVRITINSEELKNTIIARDFFARGSTNVGPTVHTVTATDIEPTNPSFRLPEDFPGWDIDSPNMTIEIDQGPPANYVTQRLAAISAWDYASMGPSGPGVVYVNIDKGTYTVPSGTGLIEGNHIRVTYTPKSKSVIPEVLHDILSIALISDREGGNSSGIYEYVTDLSKEEFYSLDDLRQVLQRILDLYAYPKITGSFTTYSDIAYGWRPGQRFTGRSVYLEVWDYKAEYLGQGKAYMDLFVTTVATEVVGIRDLGGGFDEAVLRYTINFSTIPREI